MRPSRAGGKVPFSGAPLLHAAPIITSAATNSYEWSYDPDPSGDFLVEVSDDGVSGWAEYNVLGPEARSDDATGSAGKFFRITARNGSAQAESLTSTIQAWS